MPLTPFHFGPSAAITFPLHRELDPPTFVLVNVAVDLEPLAVILLRLNYPLHGYAHTFVGATLVGMFTAMIVYSFRHPVAAIMTTLWPLPYAPRRRRIILSGVLGALFHVLLDAPLYPEMHPFWPLMDNPFYGLITYDLIIGFCLAGYLLAVVFYVALWLQRHSSTGPSRP